MMEDIVKNLKVKDIVEVTNGKLILGSKDFECENFSKDTRQINKGDIYIGIKGEKFDGSRFWKQALDIRCSMMFLFSALQTPIKKENFLKSIRL